MQNLLKSLAALILCALIMTDADAQSYPAMTGFVDMHAHPRGDLAFGTELFYGAPYGDIAVAMGSCKHDHSKNLLRSILASSTEQQNCPTYKDGKVGYPDFASWPSWCSILHQQMWVDWIERAHKGGLNIMVALAVSSHTIAYAAQTHGPRDDKQVMLNCIQGIKDLAAHSTFMEVAYTPDDVRRIVASGKLAVILGSEMDNIGNFYSPADHYKKATFNPAPTNEEVQAELDKLYALGIRYIFPVHLNNTVFGGTAVFNATLNVPNKFVTGAEWKVEEVSTKESGIAFHLQHPGAGLPPIAKAFMPLLMPKEINPAKKSNYTIWDTMAGFGHRNAQGETDRGRFAIGYMMKKGFLIDIDHMSEKMANEVLDSALAHDYPVNSGHNEPRGQAGNENGRTLKQYAQLKQLGGMIGVGHGWNASDFVRTYHQVAEIMGNTHMAIGTDVGGFSAQPQRDTAIKLIYDDSFPHCKTGNRTWDINTEGMAHYGLLADYVRSWKVAGMSEAEQKTFMSSAEDFTQMWEKCERRKKKLDHKDEVLSADISDFIPRGYVIQDSVTADLNVDSLKDKLLVLSIDSKLDSLQLVKVFGPDYDGPIRVVLILLQQKDKVYKLAARSDSLINDYAAWIGSFGGINPLSGLRASAGEFSFDFQSHGGGQNCTRTISFIFDKKINNWVLNLLTDNCISFNASDGSYDGKEYTHHTQENFGRVLFIEYSYRKEY